MNNIQNYSQVYEYLEKEVLSLTFDIYFDDNQIEVYSLKILDLIIRSCIEIESLIKDIYRNEKGTEVKNVSDALIELDRVYGLQNKKIIIYSPYFHFSEERKYLYPFEYKKHSKEDFYSTYCALKHDRNKNISKATIETLLRSLCALYILNIYNRNESVQVFDGSGKNFDATCGSKIFKNILYPCQYILSTSGEDIVRSNCIYEVDKNENQYSLRIQYINDMDEEAETTIVTANEEFQKYVKNRHLQNIVISEFLTYMSNFMHLTQDEILRFLNERFKVTRICNIRAEKMKPSYVAKIVRN